MMQTDVKSVFITGSGANAYAGPARVKAISIAASGACVFELTDGSSSGTSRLKVGATAGTNYMLLPGEGVQFQTSVYVNSLTNAVSATIFYG